MRAFTLIELLVVICIVGLIATLSIPLFYAGDAASSPPVAVSATPETITVYKTWCYAYGDEGIAFRASARREGKPEEVFAVASEKLFGMLHPSTFPSPYQVLISEQNELVQVGGVNP
jgi:prepilin-type N-terminal cleavage/methylation domain-containing protein